MYNYIYSIYVYVYTHIDIFNTLHIVCIYICGLLYNISVFTSVTVLEVRADRGHIAWWDMMMDI